MKNSVTKSQPPTATRKDICRKKSNLPYFCFTTNYAPATELVTRPESRCRFWNHATSTRFRQRWKPENIRNEKWFLNIKCFKILPILLFFDKIPKIRRISCLQIVTVKFNTLPPCRQKNRATAPPQPENNL